ncbi:hypothetical protein SAMD00019534_059670 [Acytostelium subglobosum LB1]|uniref:hypothetical protein n=1 Tax=Acytostelium subglobosum LB1 TaxID=1410327 RepID=UPI0006451C59|nr:hypothetical protein SAMD00019534_059670 [Acytostelium subglobosum LB1]GAM22792.1 hypothetical protein SAMD00019534_059670 [Acytostelium subglobosum LB1]|eukprot:XP_012754019.1 hypothetical protein SAMD00019534_059670 [Acytostelium subglobosum LB1]
MREIAPPSTPKLNIITRTRGVAGRKRPTRGVKVESKEVVNSKTSEDSTTGDDTPSVPTNKPNLVCGPGGMAIPKFNPAAVSLRSMPKMPLRDHPVSTSNPELAYQLKKVHLEDRPSNNTSSLPSSPVIPRRPVATIQPLPGLDLPLPPPPPNVPPVTQLPPFVNISSIPPPPMLNFPLPPPPISLPLPHPPSIVHSIQSTSVSQMNLPLPPPPSQLAMSSPSFPPPPSMTSTSLSLLSRSFELPLPPVVVASGATSGTQSSGQGSHAHESYQQQSTAYRQGPSGGSVGNESTTLKETIWIEHLTNDGRRYYHERISNVTSWTKPNAPFQTLEQYKALNKHQQQPPQKQLQHHQQQQPPQQVWIEHITAEGKRYYHEKISNITSWTRPNAPYQTIDEYTPVQVGSATAGSGNKSSSGSLHSGDTEKKRVGGILSFFLRSRPSKQELEKRNILHK